MPGLSLRFFHSFEALRDDTLLPGIHLREGRRLLAYLVLRSGEPISSWELAKSFWPAEARNNSPGQGDYPNVRQALRSLRKALGPDAERVTRPDRYTVRFDTAGLDADVLEFDRLVKVREAEIGVEAASVNYARAVSLYRGDLLRDWNEDWLVSERRRRRRAYENVLRRLIQNSRQSPSGDKGNGTEQWLRLLVAALPEDQEAVRDLLRLLNFQGRTEDAAEVLGLLRQHIEKTGRELDAETLGMAEDLRRLREAKSHYSSDTLAIPAVPVMAQTTAALATTVVTDTMAEAPRPARGNNLPIPSTSFMGREIEIAELRKRLTAEETSPAVRVVTLTGIGGVGKTRMALEAARQIAEIDSAKFHGGIWWVELEDAQESGAAYRLMAETLRLPRDGGTTANAERVRTFLAEQAPLLLILDNVEQVRDADTMIRDLTTAAPGVSCLLTSRRTLQVRAEAVLEIFPLSADEALQMFNACARRRCDTFVITEENRPDVVTLCRRLDHLPLAIELAAARCAVLTPRQMAERVSDRFRLLKTQNRSVPPRQQALRAALDWSFDLLTNSERSLFLQLSVFAGGFRLEDAEAICEADDVFEGVFALRGHSLLSVELDNKRQQMRYLLLDTVRDYVRDRRSEQNKGQEKKNDTREPSSIDERHALHYASFAEGAISAYRTAEEAASLQALMREVANLEAALQWAQQHARPALFSRLCLIIGSLRQRRGFVRDAFAPIEAGIAALEGIESDEAVSVKLHLIRELSGLHLDTRQPDTAFTFAQAARTLAEAKGDENSIGLAENLLGQASVDKKDFAAGRGHYEKALAYFASRTGDRRAQIEAANLYNNLGLLERRDKNGENSDAAVRYFEEALRLRHILNDRRGVAETLNNLGTFAFEAQDWIAADQFYSEALRYEQELGNTSGVARVLNNLGEVAAERNEPERAILYYIDALRLFRRTQSPDAAYTEGLLRESAYRAGKSEDIILELLQQTEP